MNSTAETLLKHITDSFPKEYEYTYTALGSQDAGMYLAWVGKSPVANIQLEAMQGRSTSVWVVVTRPQFHGQHQLWDRKNLNCERYDPTEAGSLNRVSAFLLDQLTKLELKELVEAKRA